MKIKLPYLFFWLLLPIVAFSQNQVPKLTNVKVLVDEKEKQIDFLFDLSDKEETEVNIYLKVSDDGGKYFQVVTTNAQGNIGEKVAVGPNKKITWSYKSLDLDLERTYFRLIADDGYEIPMDEILAKVDTNRMKENMMHITISRNHESEEGIENLKLVRNIIENSFQNSGLTTRRQEFYFGGFNGQNIIGRKAGLVNEKSNFVMMGHFDSVASKPGNVISTNGMVGVLEIMQVLTDYQFENTILGTAFDVNYPEFMGANNFVWKEGGLPAGETVEGAFYINGIGSDYFATGQFSERLKQSMSDDWVNDDYHGTYTLGFASEQSAPLLALFRETSTEFVPSLKLADQVVNGFGEEYFEVQSGNHAPFWYHHYPAIFITTWMGMRPIPIPENKTFAEAALEMNSLKSMSTIVKATVATLVKAAQIKHCSLYESRLTDLIK